MKSTHFIFSLFFALLFVACSKELELDNSFLLEPVFTENQSDFTDSEIMEAAYSLYRFPYSFEAQEVNGTALFYENSASIKQVSSSESSYELCTDNQQQAMLWAKESIYTSAIEFTVVSVVETEKYFEVKKVNNASNSDIILSRIHKCSYLQRYSFNNESLNVKIGVFNFKPFSVERIKSLIEYLWFIDNANKKALSSFTTETSENYIHTIYQLEIEIATEGNFDKLHVSKMVYTVHKTSGEINRTFAAVKSINGKQR